MFGVVGGGVFWGGVFSVVDVVWWWCGCLECLYFILEDVVVGVGVGC